MDDPIDDYKVSRQAASLAELEEVASAALKLDAQFHALRSDLTIEKAQALAVQLSFMAFRLISLGRGLAETENVAAYAAACKPPTALQERMH